MEYVEVTRENLEKEHVCCAISNNKDCQVAAKKGWLKDRFDDGLVFLKGNVRGKFFIEYIPAEKAWAPVNAPEYMYIDCFWIAGQFKGHGYANELLEKCISDSKKKGKKGLCILSSQKKKTPFLSDLNFLEYKGFKVADTAAPFFTLMYLPFYDNSAIPLFRNCIKVPPKENGLVIYYTHQCPYTAKYVPILSEVAEKNGVSLKTVKINSAVQAQNAPSPYTSFSCFRNGEFISHEIFSPAKFQKLIDEIKKQYN